VAAAGREVFGADAAEEMLHLARTAVGHGPALRPCSGRGEQGRTPGERPVPFVAADARQLPFPNGSFDLTFSMRLLHRVEASEERTQVLKELCRVSRRWVICSFYNRRSWRGLRERMRGRYAGETRCAIAREAAEAGLRVERFVPVSPLARQTLVVCSVACPERSRGGASTLDADPHQA
jgi:hypothetical protein